jgi:hypothetical protein
MRLLALRHLLASTNHHMEFPMRAKKTKRQIPATKKTKSKARSVWLALIKLAESLIKAIQKSSFKLGKLIQATGFGVILLSIVLVLNSGQWVLELLPHTS